jgi:hypothetical protein
MSRTLTKISEDTPKLLAGLIMKCWDAKAERMQWLKRDASVAKLLW